MHVLKHRCLFLIIFFFSEYNTVKTIKKLKIRRKTKFLSQNLYYTIRLPHKHTLLYITWIYMSVKLQIQIFNHGFQRQICEVCEATINHWTPSAQQKFRISPILIFFNTCWKTISHFKLFFCSHSVVPASIF